MEVALDLRILGIESTPQQGLHERVGRIIELTARGGRGRFSPRWETMFARLRGDIEVTRLLWESLTAAEQERAGRLLSATIAMTSSMTSVVHA